MMQKNITTADKHSVVRIDAIFPKISSLNEFTLIV